MDNQLKQCAGTPRPAGSVSSACSDLASASERLGRLVQELGSRLAPVLRDEPVNGCGVAEQTATDMYCSELARSIAQDVAFVSIWTDRIEGLLNRLEL